MLSACFVSNLLEALKPKPQPEEESYKVLQTEYDEAKTAPKVKDKTPEVVPEKTPERKVESVPEKVPPKVAEEKKAAEKIPMKVESEKPERRLQKEAKASDKTEKTADVKQPQAADETLRKGTAEADPSFLSSAIVHLKLWLQNSYLVTHRFQERVSVKIILLTL